MATGILPIEHPSLVLLELYCKSVAFGAGEALRAKGQHYTSLYLITDGEVSVRLGSDSKGNNEIVLGSGAAVGEIGFLRGSPATADVVATKASNALVIDDTTLQRIQHQKPDLAVTLLRYLAATTEQRSQYNSAFLDLTAGFNEGAGIEVLLCRNDAMMERALKLRYEVYCGELGRESPYADHEEKTIRDSLDEFGHTFIVIADGQAVGTLRANLSCEGYVGILAELYGMGGSEHHPDRTCICTKFIAKKSHRGGAVAMNMLGTVTRYMIRHGMQECYIDCIPSLLTFYKALGFKESGAAFHHYENGPSHPMRLDRPDAQKLTGELGPMQTMRLYLKAQKHRVTDSVRRSRKKP